MPDRVISVPQATQIATKIKNKFDKVNGRLTEHAEGIDNLTMRPSEAAELLSIARGKGGS
jgi:Skp family chaperone for outer membrane proteins